MAFAEINGARINYMQVACTGESLAEPELAEDLLMIHGLATSMAFWYMNMVPELSKRYRVTLYDLRGHGRSSITPEGYTPEQMAADLRALMDQLGIERAHLVSHSFGAITALRFAAEQPERVASLVLADSHIGEIRRLQSKSDWRFAEKIQPVLDRHGIGVDTADPYFGYRLLKEVAKKQQSEADISEKLLEIVGPLISGAGRKSAARWVKLLDTSSAESELMGEDGLSIEVLKTFRFPILALYGEHSQAMTTGEKLLLVWPHARFCIAKGSGHFFPMVRPRFFLRECLSFWQRQRTQPVVLRAADPSRRNYFRSDRFEEIEGLWYFHTREGRRGPFADINRARAALDEYTQEKTRSLDDQIA